MRALIATFLCLWSGVLVAQSNPRYTYWIDGPCGQTVLGTAGSTWDDGTGGGPYFDERLPGQTWDVVLTTADNEWPWGVRSWGVALGIEGRLRITAATVNGTAGCLLRAQGGHFPECRRDQGGFELIEITGPPDGSGPQTEDNVGLISTLVLNIGHVDPQLPLEGSEKVLKLRVLAGFPETQGEVVTVGLFFATRVGSRDFSVRPGVSGPFETCESCGDVTVDQGDPPLTVVPCRVFLKATSASAFRRCDPDDDGRLTLPDAVWIFAELFRGGRATRCPAAADCNGDGARDLSDGIYGLRYLFTDAPPPPAPFPDCGFADLPEEECPPGSTTCP